MKYFLFLFTLVSYSLSTHSMNNTQITRRDLEISEIKLYIDEEELLNRDFILLKFDEYVYKNDAFQDIIFNDFKEKSINDFYNGMKKEFQEKITLTKQEFKNDNNSNLLDKLHKDVRVKLEKDIQIDIIKKYKTVLTSKIDEEKFNYIKSLFSSVKNKLDEIAEGRSTSVANTIIENKVDSIIDLTEKDDRITYFNQISKGESFKDLPLAHLSDGLEDIDLSTKYKIGNIEVYCFSTAKISPVWKNKSKYFKLPEKMLNIKLEKTKNKNKIQYKSELSDKILICIISEDKTSFKYSRQFEVLKWPPKIAKKLLEDAPDNNIKLALKLKFSESFSSSGSLESLALVLPNWSPESHKFYGENFRKCILSFLLALKSKAAKTNLKIPKFLLFKIIRESLII
jgi:hypothetical protein